MAILKIQTGVDNIILRTKSKIILKIDKNIKNLIKDMCDTLDLDGIGLAAPQVGHNLRIVLVTMNSGKKNQNTVVMINPEILKFSDNMTIMEEGCLSLPKVFAKLKRPNEVLLKYFDEKMKEHLLHLTDLNARIVQHEIDHLDAILFVDRMEGGLHEYKTGEKIEAVTI